MLRITIIRSADGAIRYHADALSKEDYYNKEVEVPAIWSGKTAALLGLSGKVTKEDFANLAKNIHPKTGERLTVRNAANRRSGFDLTWNAPKSVSVTYALNKDKEILKAHEYAVQKAMEAIEQDMQTQATQLGVKHYQHTGNIAYANFTHFTARPVETLQDDKKIYVADPHLHTHSFLMNCTWDEKTQRFQAVEMGTIHRLAPYYEAVYRSHLSKILTEIGYPIERTKDAWEIKGVSRSIIEAYSNRTQQIEKIAKDKGITDAKTKAQIGARSRVNKSKAVAKNELHKLWEQRISKKELFLLKAIKGSQPKANVTSDATPEIDQSLKDLLERKSVIEEKRVLAKAMSLGYGRLLPEDVHKAMDKKQGVLSTFKQTIKYITTEDMVRAEEKMLNMATETKGMFQPINTDYKIQQEFLNKEQQDAIQLLLHSRDQVNLLIGGAGVGKSSLLAEVKAGVEQAGKEIFAYAPSAMASRKVLREKGFTNSDTIASLLLKNELQEQLKDNVLLIDEAGMLGTQTTLELIQLAKDKNARLILSGDHKQHHAISHGDSLRHLQERAQLQTAMVRTVVRQKHQGYKKAIQALADGDTFQGFKRLDKMNAIIEIEDQKERERKIAQSYIASLKAKKTALVVSPTHAEGRSITAAIRQQMKAERMITGKEHNYVTLSNTSLTEAQKQDEAQYTAGMNIRFHQNVKGGFTAGQHFKILERKHDRRIFMQSLDDNRSVLLPLDAAKHFEVYQEQETPIAKGDLIAVTVNSKTREQSKINNGQTFTIEGFTKDGSIKLSNGKTLDKDFRHFRHAHVNTSYSTQGKDADHIILAQSILSLPASNQKQFYVSVSRGKEKCQIFCDDKQELKQAILRSGDRMSAKDLADQHYKRITREKRQRYYQQELKREHDYEKRISKQPERYISQTRNTYEKDR